MKRILALTVVSTALLTTLGCQKPTAPSSTSSPTPVASPSPSAASTQAPVAAPPSAQPTDMPTKPAGGPPPPQPSHPPVTTVQPVPKLVAYQQPESGIALDVPEDWPPQSKGADVTVLRKPDESVILIITTVPTDQADNIGKSIDKEMEQFLTKVKANGELETRTSAYGFKIYIMRGTGLQRDRTVTWSSVIVKGKARDSFAMYGIGDVEMNEPTMRAMYTTFRPAEQGMTVEGEGAKQEGGGK